MLKAALFVSQGFGCESYTIRSPCCQSILRRAASTNTAIHLGIRRSNSRGKGDDYRPRYDRSGSANNATRQTPISPRSFDGPRGSRFGRQQKQEDSTLKPRAGPREDGLRRPYVGSDSNPRRTKESGGQSVVNREPDRFKNREDSFRAQVREYEGHSSSTPARIGRHSSRQGDDASDPYDDRKSKTFANPKSKTDSFRQRDDASERYGDRKSKISAYSKDKTDSFRQRDDASGRYGDRKSKISAYSKDKTDSFRQRRGLENSRSPPPSPPLSNKALRAERRAAMYGPGDTLPGGIPRYPRAEEENENPLRAPSQQVRNPTELRESFIHNDDLENGNGLGNKWSSPDAKPREGRLKDPNVWPPQKLKSNAPLSIPYTTPASEFLYGTSVIAAALNAERRKMYKLYIYDGENREVRAQEVSIRKLALAKGVEVVGVQGDWSRLMDKMSNGRPHNGYILEASPLPKLPVTGLQPVLERQAAFHVCLDHQSREDEIVNGNNTSIESYSTFPRYPFVLFLDGVLDPGNLGAILRTAFFLGVDALAISTRNSAPLSPVALKASAGACETLPIFSVSHAANFIDDSRKNGWKFYAAAAPAEPGAMPQYQGRKKPAYYTTSTLQNPNQKHPSVLMLGGEGEGLRRLLEKKADYLVGVEGNRAGQGGVDSLNVSVAAGLLCDAFMKKPAEKHGARNQITNPPASSLGYDNIPSSSLTYDSPPETADVTALQTEQEDGAIPDDSVPEDNGTDAVDEDVDVDSPPPNPISQTTSENSDDPDLVTKEETPVADSRLF